MEWTKEEERKRGKKKEGERGSLKGIYSFEGFSSELLSLCWFFRICHFSISSFLPRFIVSLQIVNEICEIGSERIRLGEIGEGWILIGTKRELGNLVVLRGLDLSVEDDIWYSFFFHRNFKILFLWV